MKVLVVGGAGYIGSHINFELLRKNIGFGVADSLVNSDVKNLSRLEKYFNVKIPFYECDICNVDSLRSVFESFKPDLILHLAAFKDAGESVINPKKYFDNNITGTLNILDVMSEFVVKKMVFSSSCSVYGVGDGKNFVFSEESYTNPISPYGYSKLAGELLVKSYSRAYNIDAISLRYFNVAGANTDSIIGEDSKKFGCILPNLIEAHIKDNRFKLYGDKFNTKDGTQERDYVHVTDLAKSHILAIDRLRTFKGYEFYNVGTGVPSSNLSIIKLLEEISGKKVEYDVVEPREGDPEIAYAIANKIKEELTFNAQFTIRDIVESAYKWHIKRTS